MKVTLNEVTYHIYWKYNKYVKQRPGATIQFTSVTCFIKRNGHITQKTINIEGIDSVVRSRGRKLSLDLILHSMLQFNRMDRAFIWDAYRATQQGSLADIRIKVKDVIRAIKGLSLAQKEALQAYFTPTLENTVFKETPVVEMVVEESMVTTG